MDVPRRAARNVRGALIASREHQAARIFSMEAEDPILLTHEEEVAVLRAVWVCMQQGSEHRARELLPLRVALREHLGRDVR